MDTVTPLNADQVAAVERVAAESAVTGMLRAVMALACAGIRLTLLDAGDAGAPDETAREHEADDALQSVLDSYYKPLIGSLYRQLMMFGVAGYQLVPADTVHGYGRSRTARLLRAMCGTAFFRYATDATSGSVAWDTAVADGELMLPVPVDVSEGSIGVCACDEPGAPNRYAWIPQRGRAGGDGGGWSTDLSRVFGAAHDRAMRRGAGGAGDDGEAAQPLTMWITWPGCEPTRRGGIERAPLYAMVRRLAALEELRLEVPMQDQACFHATLFLERRPHREHDQERNRAADSLQQVQMQRQLDRVTAARQRAMAEARADKSRVVRPIALLWKQLQTQQQQGMRGLDVEGLNPRQLELSERMRKAHVASVASRTIALTDHFHAHQVAPPRTVTREQLDRAEADFRDRVGMVLGVPADILGVDRTTSHRSQAENHLSIFRQTIAQVQERMERLVEEAFICSNARIFLGHLLTRLSVGEAPNPSVLRPSDRAAIRRADEEEGGGGGDDSESGDDADAARPNAIVRRAMGALRAATRPARAERRLRRQRRAREILRALVHASARMIRATFAREPLADLDQMIVMVDRGFMDADQAALAIERRYHTGVMPSSLSAVTDRGTGAHRSHMASRAAAGGGPRRRRAAARSAASDDKPSRKRDRAEMRAAAAADAESGDDSDIWRRLLLSDHAAVTVTVADSYQSVIICSKNVAALTRAHWLVNAQQPDRAAFYRPTAAVPLAGEVDPSAPLPDAAERYMRQKVAQLAELLAGADVAALQEASPDLLTRLGVSGASDGPLSDFILAAAPAALGEARRGTSDWYGGHSVILMRKNADVIDRSTMPYDADEDAYAGPAWMGEGPLGSTVSWIGAGGGPHDPAAVIRLPRMRTGAGKPVYLVSAHFSFGRHADSGTEGGHAQALAFAEAATAAVPGDSPVLCVGDWNATVMSGPDMPPAYLPLALSRGARGEVEPLPLPLPNHCGYYLGRWGMYDFGTPLLLRPAALRDTRVRVGPVPTTAEGASVGGVDAEACARALAEGAAPVNAAAALTGPLGEQALYRLALFDPACAERAIAHTRAYDAIRRRGE